MTNFYIRISGNDLYSGLSGSGAWRTLGKANSTLNAGDTVYIGAGNYSSESVDPTNAGSSGSLIIYYGDKLGENTGDIGSILAKDFDINKEYISIKGIDFDDPCAFGSIGTHPDGCIVDACSMPSLIINYPYDTYVENCMIGPSSADVVSLDVTNANQNIFVLYNTIIGPSSFTNGDQADTKGVLSILTNGKVYAKNNIIVANCNMKLLYLDTYDYNNYVNYNRYHSSSYGTFFSYWYESGYQVESTFGDWQTNSGQDANSSVGDPDFVGGGNYHILPSSPCVGVATDVGIDHDYDYDTRNSDIGADEVTINTRQRIILSNANITGTIQQLLLSDANVVILNNQQIITSDANVAFYVQQTILSDANIVIGDVQQTILSDANIQIENNQQIIISDAFVIPATSPDYFSFAKIVKDVPNFSFKTEDKTKTILTDAKLKHDCTHNLPSGNYTLNTCPRCLGKGYYYDIKFSPLGDIYTIKETEKLLQELVKITITSKGQNIFHSKYGSYVSDSIGMVQTKDFREARLKQSIMDAVLRLKYLQREGIEQGYKFSLKELIDKVSNIEIYEIANNPTQLGFKVEIITVDNTIAVLQGAIYL